MNPLLPLALTMALVDPSSHNFAGYLKSLGGYCAATIQGGQTCGSCADLIQRSLRECPNGSAPPSCSPVCP